MIHSIVENTTLRLAIQPCLNMYVRKMQKMAKTATEMVKRYRTRQIYRHIKYRIFTHSEIQF